MKNKITSLLLCAGLFLPLLVMNCALDALTGGSEIGNPTQCTVIGTAVYAGTGTPAAGAVVHARKIGYLRDTNISLAKTSAVRYDVFTDSNGRFTLSDIDTGAYRLEINDGNSRGALLSCTAKLGSVTLPVATLKPTVTVIGTVKGKFADYLIPAFIQVFGLDRVTKVDAAGRFTLYTIPEGSFTLRVVSGTPDYASRDTSITVVSTVTSLRLDPVLLTPFAAWGNSKKIYLNTTATGADISADVHDFPLLVRLQRVHFTLNGVSVNAQDLRFAKSDGTPLSYEIEQWNPMAAATDAAVIWVRMDTVFGNKTSQYIVMSWTRQMSDLSNGAAVFDTAAGFAGVWHMNESLPGLVKDRTRNAYNATPMGMNIGNSTVGVIGNCLNFDGFNDHLRLPTVSTDFTHGMTVSGWVKYRRFNMWSRIIDWCENSQGSNEIMLGNAGTSADLQWNVWNADSGNGNPVDVAAFFAPIDEWVNVTATYVGTSMAVYRNGAFAGSAAVNYKLVNVSRTSCFIGASNWPLDSLFCGNIDELQVSKVARNPTWTKLQYESQKPGSTVVDFTRP